MPVVKELALVNLNQWIKEQQRRREKLHASLLALDDPGSDYGETIQLLIDVCDDAIIAISQQMGVLEGGE